MHNPYQSPAVSAAPILQSGGKRPFSVWLLAAAFGAMAILLAISAVRLAVFVASRPGQVNGIYVLVIMCSVVIVPAVAVVLLGVLRRRQWARWLGALVLGAITVLMLFLPDSTQYANAQRGGAFLARTILLPSLMAWWVYGCAFSGKAKRYFTD